MSASVGECVKLRIHQILFMISADAVGPTLMLKCETDPPIFEALVPHLTATLAMDWQTPPASIADRLENLQFAQEHNCGSDDYFQKRCQNLMPLLGDNSWLRLPVNFEVMRAVQKQLLGASRIDFRQTIAQTSIRRERYGYFDELESIFRRKLVADLEDEVHPLLQAARLYLDIIFFHPFEDGNARAALFWLAFLLNRNQIGYPRFKGVALFPFQPGSQVCYWEFCYFLAEEVTREST